MFSFVFVQREVTGISSAELFIASHTYSPCDCCSIVPPLFVRLSFHFPPCSGALAGGGEAAAAAGGGTRVLCIFPRPAARSQLLPGLPWQLGKPQLSLNIPAVTVRCGMCRPGKALMSCVGQSADAIPGNAEPGWHCCRIPVIPAWRKRWMELLWLLPQLLQPRHSAHSTVMGCGLRDLSCHKSPQPYSQAGPAVCSLGICYKSGIQRWSNAKQWKLASHLQHSSSSPRKINYL